MKAIWTRLGEKQAAYSRREAAKKAKERAFFRARKTGEEWLKLFRLEEIDGRVQVIPLETLAARIVSEDFPEHYGKCHSDAKAVCASLNRHKHYKGKSTYVPYVVSFEDGTTKKIRAKNHDMVMSIVDLMDVLPTSIWVAI